MQSNPYQLPNAATQTAVTRQTHWYHSFVVPISKMAFWVGVVLGILGSLISFVPGGEAYWFGFTSILIAAGLFADSNKYRISAGVLLVFCLAATYNGYIRGIEHQEFLKTRPN